MPICTGKKALSRTLIIGTREPVDTSIDLRLKTNGMR
jgi:hypothetical protein